MIIKRKQTAVIGLVAVLMVLLLSLDIKGLVKESSQHSGAAASNASQMAEVSVEKVSATAKQTIEPGLSAEITSLENQFAGASGPDKLNFARQLARKWEDVNQPAPEAFYYEQIAQSENSFSDWLKAGDLFSSAYQSTQDSLMQPGLVAKAVGAYQKALELKPDNLDAKTGLGVAYVNGGAASPMQGIGLLLDVVKQDPNNVKANMSLGLFSIKSGQFDKAVNRFQKVLVQQQTPDAWFYLATCFENLGQKDDAVKAYQRSKELAADPGFSNYIDKRISELKK